jgi:hypothetical protein
MILLAFVICPMILLAFCVVEIVRFLAAATYLWGGGRTTEAAFILVVFLLFHLDVVFAFAFMRFPVVLVAFLTTVGDGFASGACLERRTVAAISTL